jgi:hypothetical protein
MSRSIVPPPPANDCSRVCVNSKHMHACHDNSAPLRSTPPLCPTSCQSSSSELKQGHKRNPRVTTFSTAQPLLLHLSNHSLPPIRGNCTGTTSPNWHPNQADVVGNRQLLDGNQRLSLLLHGHVQEHRGIGARRATSVSGDRVVAGPSP